MAEGRMEEWREGQGQRARIPSVRPYGSPFSLQWKYSICQTRTRVLCAPEQLCNCTRT